MKKINLKPSVRKRYSFQRGVLDLTGYIILFKVTSQTSPGQTEDQCYNCPRTPLCVLGFHQTKRHCHYGMIGYNSYPCNKEQLTLNPTPYAGFSSKRHALSTIMVGVGATPIPVLKNNFPSSLLCIKCDVFIKSLPVSHAVRSKRGGH